MSEIWAFAAGALTTVFLGITWANRVLKDATKRIDEARDIMRQAEAILSGNEAMTGGRNLLVYDGLQTEPPIPAGVELYPCEGGGYVCSVDEVWIEGVFATRESAIFWSQQSPGDLHQAWLNSLGQPIQLPVEPLPTPYQKVKP